MRFSRLNANNQASMLPYFRLSKLLLHRYKAIFWSDLKRSTFSTFWWMYYVLWECSSFWILGQMYNNFTFNDYLLQIVILSESVMWVNEANIANFVPAVIVERTIKSILILAIPIFLVSVFGDDWICSLIFLFLGYPDRYAKISELFIHLCLLILVSRWFCFIFKCF